MRVSYFPCLRRTSVFINYVKANKISQSSLRKERIRRNLITRDEQARELFSRRSNATCRQVLRVYANKIRTRTTNFCFTTSLQFSRFRRFFIKVRFIYPSVSNRFTTIQGSVILYPNISGHSTRFRQSRRVTFFQRLVNIRPFSIFRHGHSHVSPLIPNNVSYLTNTSAIRSRRPFFNCNQLRTNQFTSGNRYSEEGINGDTFRPILTKGFFFT